MLFRSSYSTFSTDAVGTATFSTDKATGLTMTVTGATATVTNMDAQNDLLKALKSAGVNLTASSTYGTNAANTTTYTLTLNGDAANKYDVVTTAATSGKFEIRSKNGETLLTIQASGYNKQATDKGAVSDTVAFNATKIGAASSAKAQAAYYDKDGNKISVNDLDNYFATYYTGATDTIGTTSAKADAAKVYDADRKSVV